MKKGHIMRKSFSRNIIFIFSILFWWERQGELAWDLLLAYLCCFIFLFFPSFFPFFVRGVRNEMETGKG